MVCCLSNKPTEKSPGNLLAENSYSHLRGTGYTPHAKLQELLKRYFFCPEGKLSLDLLKNQDGDLIPVGDMRVAYSRYHNLSNLPCYRKISKRPGPKVSSCMIRYK